MKKYKVCEYTMTYEEMKNCYKEITGLDNANEFTSKGLRDYLVEIFED